ncbi:amidohydrolase/deacetylase family metallohydrolase [Pseudolysinimonas kribbensis]|uniref:Amidohydrolase n=1 Tax=Pseudolysinimonas kribbensis TaxID=433641 RepID=A0ABQ6K229_9MICO|nr:amidohydrolase/deacetylase family metallohydrolase [Pseudolysinimonas kribbensis]GMA94663.1 amidohydrolase [Pseudolysinimonas kribbensis]
MTDLDLLISGGRVLDPSRAIDLFADLAIRDGRVVEIASRIERARAARVVDATGALVTPGLVDLHTHVLGGVLDSCADPDDVGIRSGVTTVVDAGSAGAGTIGAFANWIIPNRRTRVIPFLHIATTGFATNPEITAESDVDFKLVERSLTQYEGLIGGLKVRMVNPALRILGIEMLRRSVEIAHAAGLPVMVHIGDVHGEGPADLGARTLELLGPGDIVTHLFTPHPGGILDGRRRVIPEAFAAAERGIRFDAAHGRGNFSFDVAREVFDQGIRIDAISTDMTAAGRRDVVYTMTEVMSRYLGLGFDLAEVIALSTSGPADAARRDDVGSLTIGGTADVSILDVVTGSWEAVDSVGQTLRLDRLILPRTTVRAGELIAPGPGPHARGWLPDSFEPG